MAVERLTEALKDALGKAAVKVSEPLASYTALRIGGPADLLVGAADLDALCRAVMLAWEFGVPCRILGSGSNILVSDAGVCGLVVLNRARGVTWPALKEETGTRWVRAESGASFSTVAQQCVARDLAGLEWAASIPGTVGGAVVGNAGAWGGDVASTLSRARILERSGRTVEWPVERFEYKYRSSVLKKDAEREQRQVVVLDAEFALRPGNREALKAQIAAMTARRKASQPPGATCGSVFKNPAGDYAGRLIEAAGLKGRRSGGAQISTVHANFIVNHGNASAADVKALIDLARQTVQDQFEVVLELEIELLGEWQVRA